MWVLMLVAMLCATPLSAQTLNVEEGAMHEPVIASTAGLQGWLQDFRLRARALGVPQATLDAVLPGLTYLPDVVERDRNQAEFTRAIWDYLDRAVSDLRIEMGRKALEDHAALLAQIEATYGVEKEIVLAIWGLETSFGTHRGDVPTLSALATLAYDTRRRAVFESQLVAGLKIVAAGEVAPARMLGSWAGAMGHTQFMPTSYLSLAVDFDGDGRRDIWGDDPADALASAAAYLAANGWQAGGLWGLEVRLPEEFDWAQSGDRVVKPVADWAALGVAPAAGGALPDHGPAVLRLPAGHRGAAFLTFTNFFAIESYNPADAYVIAIGHLADRLRGAGPLLAGWPREDGVLKGDERAELQRLLTEAGFDTLGADGKIGPNTQAAIKLWQKANAAPADGYAGPALLAALRGR
jgi:membrane-bound lytic murein transglycosylase B